MGKAGTAYHSEANGRAAYKHARGLKYQNINSGRKSFLCTRAEPMSSLGVTSLALEDNVCYRDKFMINFTRLAQVGALRLFTEVPTV